MAMIDKKLSQAIIVFIGKGHTKAPAPDRARVIDALGPISAQSLLPRIDDIIAELGAIPVNWDTMDLNQATDHVIAAMRERHPELSEPALMALDWLFSYSWR